SPAKVEVAGTTEIYETSPDGQKWGRAVLSLGPTVVKVGPHATEELAATGVIQNPKLWGLKKTNRYIAVTTLEQDGKVVNSCETLFGIRKIEFTVDNGFLLNGERVALNGVCDHHDLGALGSAINTRALERQLEILQDMGCNAIRTSHNP